MIEQAIGVVALILALGNTVILFIYLRGNVKFIDDYSMPIPPDWEPTILNGGIVEGNSGQVIHYPTGEVLERMKASILEKNDLYNRIKGKN